MIHLADLPEYSTSIVHIYMVQTMLSLLYHMLDLQFTCVFTGRFVGGILWPELMGEPRKTRPLNIPVPYLFTDFPEIKGSIPCVSLCL